MRSGTKLSQFLRVFLPTLVHYFMKDKTATVSYTLLKQIKVLVALFECD